MDRVCAILRDFLKGKTMLLVTHDLDVADALANKVFNIKAGGDIEMGFISCEANGHLAFHHGEKEEAQDVDSSRSKTKGNAADLRMSCSTISSTDTPSTIEQFSREMKEQARGQLLASTPTGSRNDANQHDSDEEEIHFYHQEQEEREVSPEALAQNATSSSQVSVAVSEESDD